MGVAERINSSGVSRRLWGDLPIGEFVRLDQTHAFSAGHPVVAMKMRNLLGDLRAEGHEVGSLEFSRLELITCGGVPMGYVISAPRCSLRARPSYCTFSLHGNPTVNPAVLFVDSSLGMVGDSEAIVCVSHARNWIHRQ